MEEAAFREPGGVADVFHPHRGVTLGADQVDGGIEEALAGSGGGGHGPWEAYRVLRNVRTGRYDVNAAPRAAPRRDAPIARAGARSDNAAFAATTRERS